MKRESSSIDEFDEIISDFRSWCIGEIGEMKESSGLFADSGTLKGKQG